MPLTERGRWAATTHDERGRVVVGSLTERGELVTGVSATSTNSGASRRTMLWPPMPLMPISPPIGAEP